MADRNEKYVIHPATGRRAAVPAKHFSDVLKGAGWVIDPDGPSAGDVPPATVRASEKAIAAAAAKRETDATTEGESG